MSFRSVLLRGLIFFIGSLNGLAIGHDVGLPWLMLQIVASAAVIAFAEVALETRGAE